MLFMSQRR